MGGRRLGKTSALRAVEWNLLDPAGGYSQAFPVFINLHVEQPRDLDNFRYLLVARLREALERWKQVPGAAIREMYRQFLRQVKGGEVTVSFLQQLNIKLNIDNPDSQCRLTHEDFRSALIKTVEELQKCDYKGVCFLLDGAEFVVRQPWANDAWSYFRGLKDTDTALKPFLGLLLSGYRELKEYQQQIGSPLLNIADVEWLSTLATSETSKLIDYRMKCEKIVLSEKTIAAVQEWTGCHPYLTQQMLNIIFDGYKGNKSLSAKSLVSKLISKHDHDFSIWWNVEAHQAGGLSDSDRLVYKALAKQRNGTVESLMQDIDLSLSAAKIEDSLDLLAGAGVIWRHEEQYRIGAKLFEQWVIQQEKT